MNLNWSYIFYLNFYFCYIPFRGVSMEYTLAEFIVESFYNLGIRNFYGVIGTSIFDFIDTLYDWRDKVRFVTTRHEQTAVSMADAEYRVTHRPGAAVVHAGPGFLNSLLGLGVSYKDRVPLILISGGVRRRLYGSDAWLEVDQQAIAKALTKYTVRISDEEELVEVLRALPNKIFSKPHGPIHIEVPEDLWNRKVKGEPIKRFTTPSEERGINMNDVDEVIEYLVKSEKPAILVCGEAIQEDIGSYLIGLAERFDAYILTTGNARGACDESHPLCLGRVGFGGGSIPADKVLENADVLLVLGDELDDITTYNYLIFPSGDVIAVSENPIMEKRPIYYTKLIKNDPYIFLKALHYRVTNRDIRVDKPSWREEVQGYLDEWTVMLEEAVNRRYDGYVNPARFFKVLDEKLPSEVVITGGQGVHIVYTYAFMRIRRPMRFLAATNLGGMSYAFPAAMGAKVALPEHEVIAVVGDGEFMMSVQDFETCIREKIPVKVVVVNDNSYRVLLLRQRIQKGGRVYGTILSNPSFEKLAETFGGIGYTVDDDSKISDGVKALLESEEPFILDLRISPEDLPPLNIEASLRMAGG